MEHIFNVSVFPKVYVVYSIWVNIWKCLIFSQSGIAISLFTDFVSEQETKKQLAVTETTLVIIFTL